MASIDLACVAITDPDPGLFVYLNLAPNAETEKLQELDCLVRNLWEMEALGLVEKIPRFSNELKSDPTKHWTKAEQIAAAKMNVTYLKDMKQFQISIPWKDTPPHFSRSNRDQVKARQDGDCNRLGDKKEQLTKIFEG